MRELGGWVGGWVDGLVSERVKLKRDDFTRLDGRWGRGWERGPSGSLLAKIYF